MTSADLVLFCGYLVSSWAAGFCGGFILTRFREALNHVS